MIKNIALFLLFILLSMSARSQNVKLLATSDGNYNYQEVITVDSTNKEDLYNKLHVWVAKNYVSANDVIQYEDKETGRIIAKGLYTTTNYGWEVFLWHTLTLEAKDNRFRVTFDQLIYQGGSDGPRISFAKSVPRKKKMLERLEVKIQDSVNNIIEELRTKPVSNW